MELSVFMAQLLGLAYLAVGLGFITDKTYYRGVYEDFTKSSGMLLFGGIFAFVAGFALVTHHNVWVADWPVIITVFGWLSLIKGVMLLVFPRSMVGLTKIFAKNESFIGMVGVGAMIIGLILSYFGFIA